MHRHLPPGQKLVTKTPSILRGAARVLPDLKCHVNGRNVPEVQVRGEERLVSGGCFFAMGLVAAKAIAEEACKE